MLKKNSFLVTFILVSVFPDAVFAGNENIVNNLSETEYVADKPSDEKMEENNKKFVLKDYLVGTLGVTSVALMPYFWAKINELIRLSREKASSLEQRKFKLDIEVAKLAAEVGFGGVDQTIKAVVSGLSGDVSKFNESRAESANWVGSMEKKD
jgi:hypothetical protein